MKLTRLELTGFKSFADSVTLPFDDGVTAIVGPNGCGKSNLSDAVRWVLGEQRAKMLRSARMDEVIFQGAASRRPINIAEVSLIFDNGDGTLPISYSEVAITRRLSRGGQSDYFINGSPVRLRDIQDLLRGTGLGSNAGVVIEGRMVDSLLSDKAEERRSLFEESAGIGLYRDRKTSTERRLERTTEDLQRLEDLIGEVQTQVRSLARQKGKAERHKQFSEYRFAIVMTLARRDLQEFANRADALETRQSQLNSEIPRVRETLDEAERERERGVQLRSAAEAKRNELDRRLADERVKTEKLEGDLKLASERLQNATLRKSKALGEKVDFEKRATRAKLEREAAAEELNAARTAHSAVQTELDLRIEAEGESREQVITQRNQVRDLEERLQQLAETSRAMSGERTAARAELDELKLQLLDMAKKLESTTAERDRLQDMSQRSATEFARLEELDRKAADELERARHALAAARENENAVRVERRSAEDEVTQLEAKRDAIEELERSRAGLAPAARSLLKAREQLGKDLVHGPLSDFLETTKNSASVAERMLGDWLHAVLVKDEASVTAIRGWHKKTNPGPLVLLPVKPGPQTTHQSTEKASALRAKKPAVQWLDTLLSENRSLDPEGSAIRRQNGAVYLPALGDSSGPLARKAKLETLKTEHAKALEKQERLNHDLEKASENHRRAESDLTRAAQSSEKTRESMREAAAQHDDNRRGLQRAEREYEEFQGALTRLRSRAEERTKFLDNITAHIAKTEGERSEVEDDVESQRSALGELEEAQETARERRVQWQVEEAQIVAREEAAATRSERAETDLASFQRAAASLDAEIEAIEADSADLREKVARWEDQLSDSRAAAQELETAAVQAAESVQQAEKSLLQAETRVQEYREQLNTLTQTSHELAIEATEAAGRKRALVERIEAEFHKPLGELEQAAPEVDGDPGELRATAEHLAEKIDALGPVNPLAVEEHEQECSRLEFLTDQRDDLVEARNDLSKALREIDETARRMFLETFEKIRENFGVAFGTLFDGGRCDLTLADGGDPLESDIEIRASPRGKRTQRIDLLSSGERALVAASLLFAIYLTKPSPFCLLDEVDAPLDDANVLRFVRLIEQFKSDTQFIVITHNPRTMQIADSVYGITMQEPGVSTVVGVRLGEAKPAQF